VNNWKFWQKVRRNIEANGEKITILKEARKEVATNRRATDRIAIGQVRIQAMTPEELLRARLDYEQEVYGRRDFAAQIYRLELADSKRKARGRRAERMPFVRQAYDADTAAGEAAIPTPWELLSAYAEPVHDDDVDTVGCITGLEVNLEFEEMNGFQIFENPMAYLVSPEDRTLLDRILSKSPGRPRGRPPKLQILADTPGGETGNVTSIKPRPRPAARLGPDRRETINGKRKAA